ncbi:MAG TPA: hypothetical protein PKM73_14585 [Verrucomicrobiota bacterium]|nr:hypothetical protein [Verrucomicrobiota bacterium]HNU49798.1 hypothetical protein [Verrucomicrobiota bacterium]
MSDNSVAKKGHGCFFYGCLTLAVVVVVGLLAVFLITRSMINRMVEKYTEPTPMTLPTLELSAAEIADAQQRWKTFQEGLTNQSAKPLELTEKDINALILNNPDLAELKNKVYVSIAGDQLNGQVSIPLDNFPIGKVKGRFLNGKAGIKVSLDNGILLVTLQSLEVKGEPVPDQIMAGIRQQNLAQEAYKDVQKAEALRRLESIRVSDDRLVIVPRTDP